MATPGVIPYNQIPSPVPAGLLEACEAALVVAGFSPKASRAPEGVLVSDVPTVLATIASYAGGTSELTYIKRQKQAALDALFDASFDLAKFIRGGTTSPVTAAQIGTFLATITSNYRLLRASIASAVNVAAVNAININGGWPANP